MEVNENKKKTAESENKKMFRSRFDIFVLNALNDKDGASYGYDVINYIQNKTKGHYKIKTFSTIYNTLKRLEEQNYVISGAGDGETNGAARVYYTLTPEGKEYLDENKEEYKYLRTLLDNLLTDEDFDLENEPPIRASDLKPLTRRNRSDGASDDSAENLCSDVADAADAEIASAELSADTGSDDNIRVFTPADRRNNDPDIFEQTLNKPVRKINNTEYKAIIEKITSPVINGTSKNPKRTTVSKKKSFSDNQSVQTSTAETKKVEVNEKPKKSPVDIEEKNNLDRFKVGIKSEGYSFSTYKPKKSVSVKSIFINKLLRDSVCLTALYFLVCVLLMFLLRKTFEFSLTALLVTGSIAIVTGLIFVLIWFRMPDKRIKDTINLKAILLICVGFFTVFFMLDLIITLLIPNGKGIDSGATYAPVLAASASVFFGIIFSVLYKTENYFVK